MWYPCGTTGIPVLLLVSRQRPSRHCLTIQHSIIVGHGKICVTHTIVQMHTYKYMHYTVLQYQRNTGPVLCKVPVTCLMSSSLGIFTSTRTLVETQTPLLDNLAGPRSLLSEEIYVRKSSHQIAPSYLNQSHQCRSHSIFKSKTVHGTTRSSHHITVASQKADRHSFSHI